MNRPSRRLLLLAVLVIGLLAVPVASGATGTASAQMTMGTVNINVAGGSTFQMATPPIIWANDEPQQQLFDDLVASGERAWPGQQLDIYTIGCWRFLINDHVPRGSNNFPMVQDSLHWLCAQSDSGPATSLSAALAQTASATIGTTNPQCSWLGAYDPVTTDPNLECNSLPADFNSIKPGVYSPIAEPDMMPNLDPFVGQTVDFDVLTNWCSFVAPTGWNIAQHNGYDYYDNDPSGSSGCANQDTNVGVNLTSSGGSARALASSGPKQTCSAQGCSITVKLHVGASAYDCHVPRVKGLTLAKARNRLRRAHCSVGHVVWVRGKHLGHVRNQPLPVGTGRRKGYGVTLAVERHRH